MSEREPRLTGFGPPTRTSGSLVFPCPCRPDAPLDGLFGAGVDGEAPALYPEPGAITLCINCGQPYELTETGWRSIAVDALDLATAAAVRGAQSAIRRTTAHGRDV